MKQKEAKNNTTQTPTKNMKRSSSVPIKRQKSNKNINKPNTPITTSSTTTTSTATTANNNNNNNNPMDIINPKINSKRLEKETSEWIKRQRQIEIDKNRNLTDKSPSSYCYIKSNKVTNKPNKTPLKTIRSQPV